MRPEDMASLAEKFVSTATKTGQGDNLLIYLRGSSPTAQALAEACVAQATKVGANASIIDRGSEYMNGILANATPESLLTLGKEELERVQKFTTNINIVDDSDASKVSFD